MRLQQKNVAFDASGNLITAPPPSVIDPGVSRALELPPGGGASDIYGDPASRGMELTINEFGQPELVTVPVSIENIDPTRITVGDLQRMVGGGGGYFGGYNAPDSNLPAPAFDSIDPFSPTAPTAPAVSPGSITASLFSNYIKPSTLSYVLPAATAALIAADQTQTETAAETWARRV